MRAKEERHDYRYSPEPDLLPLDLARFGIDIHEERRGLPELPRARQRRFERAYGLSPYDAGVLTGTRGVADYFETVAQAGAPAKDAANWLMGPVLADASRHQGTLRAPPQRVAEIISLVCGGALSAQAGKRVFAEVAERDEAPAQVAERMGVVQVRDAAQLNAWVRAVLDRYAPGARRYRDGEERLMAFFVGEVMKASRGKADPRAAQEMLRHRPAERG